MKKLSMLLLLCLILQGMSAQETPDEHESRMQWWRDARFGMFIHWGLYAVPAGEWNGKTGYGEWIRTSAEIPLDVYDRFTAQFNPVLFNADEWVKTARDAGMKYIVITSKHHDGFCMFNTSQTDFNIMKTPFGRDPMKELAEACRKYNMKFCFYYSIMDWHHPDYLPRRNWETGRSSEGADYERYLSYMKAELKELLRNYGDIGVLWFDGEWEPTWNQTRGMEIYRYVRDLQREIIVNNRVGAGRIDWVGMTKPGMFGGDFGTPEQQIPAKGLPGIDWETCMTMNDHWGYNSHDKNFKSSKELIPMLCDIASKGGNYLLNVGPTAEGVFPTESMERLKDIGKWMSLNGEAIYGTTASPMSETPWGRCTMKRSEKGFRLYFHVFNWPAGRILKVGGCLNKVEQVFLLSEKNHTALKTRVVNDTIQIYLPKTCPDTICTVVAADFSGIPDFTDPPEISAAWSLILDTLNVKISTSRPDVQIRYTFGDVITVPDINSLLYNNPVVLDKGGYLTARCFRNGKAVSSPVTRKFETVSIIPPADVTPSGSFSWKYFEGEWDSIPRYIDLKETVTGNSDNISPEPAKRKENYLIVFNGFIKIDKKDLYRIILSSDDGSRLFIDGKELINNDGLHALVEKSSETALEKGYHQIRVEYLQRTGSAELGVWIEGRDLSRKKM